MCLTEVLKRAAVELYKMLPTTDPINNSLNLSLRGIGEDRNLFCLFLMIKSDTFISVGLWIKLT